MNDRPTLAERFAAIDPADLSTSEVLTYTLVEQVAGLRDDVVAEREGRELSITATRRANRLSIAAVTIIVLVIGGFVIKWRVDDARFSRTTCAERIERTNQLSAAMVAGVNAGVDTVGRYAKVPADERGPLAREASIAAGKAVADELPPPDC